MAGVGERTVPLIPEVGNVVNVRGSVWAVADVRVQGLDRSPADEVSGRLQHEVSLQSLAEDRMGEELSVVWELEVGCFIVQEQGLPESVDPQGFDDPNTLGAFVDAMRWGAVTNADDRAFQSPFRTGPTSSLTSWSRCAAPFRLRVRTCCLPTTSAWVRPSRLAWCSRSCCCVTVPARS